MGYLCPVCEEPFGGDEPLANHLALTAILHAGDHEMWLDETVDDWEVIPRTELADRVVDHAEPADEHEHPGEHSHVDVPAERSAASDGLDGVDASAPSPGSQPGSSPFSAADTDALDAEAQAILEEATAYTRAMQGDGEKAVDADTEGKES